MREIEFRIKSYHGDWYYVLPIHFSKMSNTCAFQSFDNSFYDAFADRGTLGQYTGLTDKNGTKIFEGDIIKYGTFAKGVIEYGWAKFISHRISKEKQFKSIDEYIDEYNENEFDALSDIYECEVIGNIYDNPELLGKVEE